MNYSFGQSNQELFDELVCFKRNASAQITQSPLSPTALYDDSKEVPRQLKGEQFIQYLRCRFKGHEPTSIIRLVDGEGSFLALTELKGYPAIKAVLGARIGPHFFGSHASEMKQEEFEQIGSLIKDALETADIIGVPSAIDLASARTKLERDWFAGHPAGTAQPSDLYSTESLRGFVALTVTFFIASQAVDRWRDLLTTFSGLNSWLLWEIWRLVLEAPSSRRFVGVVTCFPEFEDRLTRRLSRGQVAVKSYLVPPRGADANLSEYPHHYPDAYNSICRNVAVPFKGALFIVGAGPLGKVYCQRLKELGAIAIDMGSALDLYLGRVTRDWHSQDLIKLHRLPE